MIKREVYISIGGTKIATKIAPKNDTHTHKAKTKKNAKMKSSTIRISNL